jgi:peptidoglycan/LPS O-acetylase OafA/YrhL
MSGKASGKLDYLTGLRGLAAWWVVLYHIYQHLQPLVPDFISCIIIKGYLAVDYFFILSGFIISYTYLDKIISLPSGYIKQFYIKRLARIYPLHWTVLILYITIPLAYLITHRSLPGGDLFSIKNFLYSFFLIHNWGFQTELTWNIPSWSISTEIASYIVFPFLAYFLYRLKSDKFIFMTALLFAAIIAFSFRLLNADSLGADIEKIGLIRCILEFSLGICIYLLYRSKRVISRAVASILMLVGVLLLFAAIYLGIRDYFIIPAASFLFIYGSLFSYRALIYIFSNRFVIYIGEISYSTYLIHYLIKEWFKMLFLTSSEQGSLLWICGYLIAVLVASIVLYKIIECPSRNWIGSFGKRPHFKIMETSQEA